MEEKKEKKNIEFENDSNIHFNIELGTNLGSQNIIIEENKNESNIAFNKKNDLIPKDAKFLRNLTDDLNYSLLIDNIFLVFNSIENILQLIYYNQNNFIVSLDLNDFYIFLKIYNIYLYNQKISQIKNEHNKFVTNFRHYLDKKNKRDLIMSTYFDNCIKLWDNKNWECIFELQNIYDKGYLFSACFFEEINNTYIITSNYNFKDFPESIKVFDFKGNKIKEINNSREGTFFIDDYYDEHISKNFIVTGNRKCIKSYNYEENKLYHIYNDNANFNHYSIIFNNSEQVIKMIESSDDDIIRIWNFHSGELLNRIKLNNDGLYGISLLSKDYLFVGCGDSTIKLIDLTKGIVLNELKNHLNCVISVKIVEFHKNDKYLISLGSDADQIKLWKILFI